MDNHFYINLDVRPDRNGEMITELKKLGIKKPNRMNATKHPVSSFIGIAESHIECLEKAKELGWKHVIIFEDDIKVENKKKVIEKFNKYICEDFWDVLFLGCWNYVPPIRVNDDLAKVVKAVCIHAYVIKEHYYDTLIENYRECIKKKRENVDDGNYNHDEYFEILQQKDKWFCLIPIMITQKDGWSDNFNAVRNLSEIIKSIPK